MKTITILFALVIYSNSLVAEINIAPSLDWLACKAQCIVKAKLIEVKENESEHFKNSYFRVVISDTWKGKTKDTIQVSYEFKLSQIKTNELLNQEVMLFLDFDSENSSQYQLIGESYTKKYALIILSQKPLLAFKSDFTELLNQEELFHYVSDCVAKIKDEVCQLAYLDIDFNTFANRQLYMGSTCYLWVPAACYPLAKKRMY